jgi:ParB family chromosome partitioning protein
MRWCPASTSRALDGRREAGGTGRVDPAQGVIQPIVVREHVGADGKGGRTYEIIAGERRWRASQLAGLAEVPVVVRVVDDRTAIAMALIENIQREDLNPLEEAQALQRLIDEFDLTHAAGRRSGGTLARRGEQPAAPAGTAGRDPRWCRPVPWRWATRARCCRWPRRWRSRWRSRPPNRAGRCAKSNTACSSWHPARSPRRRRRPPPKARPQADIVALERELSESLGSRVEVVPGRGKKGKLVIHYADFDVLDGVLDRLRTKP